MGAIIVARGAAWASLQSRFSMFKVQQKANEERL